MKVETTTIKKLREMTGAGMMDCKNALAENNSDIEKSMEYLRKKGITKASKRMMKETGAGRVFSYIHMNGSIGVLLQLNCETDFVARNDEFAKLGKELTLHIAAANPVAIERQDVDGSYIKKESEIYKEQLRVEKKKEEIIEKIVEGKINKLYQDICLLEQMHIKDNKLSIQELIKEYIAKFGENITIKKFTRYQLN